MNIHSVLFFSFGLFCFDIFLLVIHLKGLEKFRSISFSIGFRGTENVSTRTFYRYLSKSIGKLRRCSVVSFLEWLNLVAKKQKKKNFAIFDIENTYTGRVSFDFSFTHFLFCLSFASMPVCECISPESNIVFFFCFWNSHQSITLVEKKKRMHSISLNNSVI